MPTVLNHTTERRIDARSKCADPVEMFFSNPEPTVVTGTVVDKSHSGFRVEHDCASLSPGMELSYCRDREMGHARVVWTMVSGSHRVSGMVIL